MAAGVNTSAGSRIFIGSTSASQPVPASDTFVEIAEVTSIGQFGRTFGSIMHSSLGNRLVKKFKGTIDDGNLQLDLAVASGDPGQAAVTAALNNDFDYNFKVTTDDPLTPTGKPTTYYFQAKVMSFPTIIGNNMQVTSARIELGIESGSITIVPPS